MELNKGAVSKRWSRLKKAMEDSNPPGGSVYKFLWLCLKHSNRDKASTHCHFHLHVLTIQQAFDWAEIAAKCGTTPGAASKRYSRMKQAFDAGTDVMPGSKSASPAPKTPSKSTPRKKAGATDGEATPTPKRKRASPKKKAVAEEEAAEDDDEEMYVKPEQEEEAAEGSDNDIERIPSKKAKVTKPKAATKPKANGKAAASKMEVVKNEEVEDDIMDTVEGDDVALGSRK